MKRYAPIHGCIHSSVAPARPVIVDCDPGHDDALAIALAVIRPELEVLGLTTVELEATTRNARRILALLGRSAIPVAAGAEGPLVRDPWIPVEYHGESGLAGADMPEPGRPPEPVTAMELAAALLRAAAEPVTLIATLLRDPPPRPLRLGRTYRHAGLEADLVLRGLAALRVRC